MKKQDKYLEALKTFDDYVTIREWAERFKKLYSSEFKEIEEKVEKNKNSTNTEKRTAIGILTARISSSIKNTKKWQLLVKEDKNYTPKRVKYVKKEERGNLTICKKATNEKSVDFNTLIEAINNVIIECDTPERDNPEYIGGENIKGIEQIKPHEFESCIIFEMAIRNDKVIEIMHKLDYINDIRDNYPYLEDCTDLYFPSIDSKINDENLNLVIEMSTKNDKGIYIEQVLDSINTLKRNYPQLEYESSLLLEAINKNIDDGKILVGSNNHDIAFKLTENLKKEYINIAKLPILDFKNELNCLIDTDFAENYNENYLQDIEEKAMDFMSMNQDTINMYKFKNIKIKTILSANSLNCGKLKIIEDFLQDELKNRYLIFPNGYYGQDNVGYEDKVVQAKEAKYIKSMLKSYSKEINDSLVAFRRLKPKNIQNIADMFFMYDYQKLYKNEDRKYLHLDIKCLLTIHHGIKNMITKKKVNCIEYLESEDENFKTKFEKKFQNSEAGFHEVEETIKEKIKLLEKFIDKEYYKYLIIKQ